jgi:putative membrane protein
MLAVQGPSSSLIYLTPFTLFITAILLFINHEGWTRRIIVSLIAIYLFGFFIEVIGINTGFPFGEYHYSPVLGLQLLETPLMIGLNWLILVYGAVYMLKPIIKNVYLNSVLAALFLLCLDLFIEPVAIRFNMWSWDGIAVPIQNFTAWAITALVLSFLLNKASSAASKNKISSLVILIQFVFFVILGQC